MPAFLNKLVTWRNTAAEQFGKNTNACIEGLPTFLSDNPAYCGSLREIYKKRMKYQERMNCKMKISQDKYGISTTIEIRGKETAPASPNRAAVR